VGGGLDANTMQLQYLETLKQVGTSPSTKIVVPMELGGLLNGLRGLLPGDAAGAAAAGAAAAAAGEAAPIEPGAPAADALPFRVSDPGEA
jgi:hypothetical protein